jgi:hypothetical protein
VVGDVTRPGTAGGGTHHRARALLYLSVGALLVLAPAAVGPVDEAVGPQPSYTYQAVEVTPRDGALVFDGPPPDGGLDSVACEPDYSRLCGLEVGVLEGDVTVRKVNPLRRQAAPYAELDGTYYRRTHDRVDGRVRFGLQPVPAGTVLEDVAVPAGETAHPSVVRRVVSEGTATVGHELDTGQVVQLDGSYYAFNVQQVETPRESPGRDLSVRLGATVAFLAGLWSLRRGWVQYDRWRGRRRANQ